MGEEKLLEPLGSYVLVKNPLGGGVVKEMEKELAQLPEDRRLEYMRENMGPIWENMEILAVGSDVRSLKMGDRVITNAEMAGTAIIVKGGSHLLIRESQFVGRWA